MPAQDHAPQGDPCKKCGEPPFRHRVKHYQDQTPCALCTTQGARHRQRTYSAHEREKKRKRDNARTSVKDTFAMVDGEGADGSGGRGDHRYTILAMKDEHGEREEHIEDVNGLSTEACLEFLLAIPNRVKTFSFSFGYDLTKILQDMTKTLEGSRALYKLVRPELRARKPGSKIPRPKPVTWGEYRLNLVGSCFTVSRGNRSRTVWDIFKFYQSPFVKALRDWRVSTDTEWFDRPGDKVKTTKQLERIEKMKGERGTFQAGDAGVLSYCFEECELGGQLARRLVEACAEVGIELRTFYGAGSIAGAILKQLGIEKKRGVHPAEMDRPIAHAFFGGRFENLVVGPVKTPLFNYDISSAYPYRIVYLPCLVHAKWRRTTDPRDVEKSEAALVHYRLPGPKEGDDRHWGPWPFREKDQTVTFPEQSGGGWIYKDEWLVGKRLFPRAVFVEAWVKKKTCKCQPFKRISEFYVQRLLLGKEGPGIILKLGPNSVYGKLAQSVGKPPYQCWIWAGMITSGCRAQILEMLAFHQDRANLLAVATDGIYTRERFRVTKPDPHAPRLTGREPRAPVPLDTGTANALDDKGKRADKPLGGWEEKYKPRGCFFARPGIYWPMQPTDEEKNDVRARGLGRKALFTNSERIERAWAAKKKTVRIPCEDRFHGIKSSVHKHELRDKKTKALLDVQYLAGPEYGNWLPFTVDVSFDPLPKRTRGMKLRSYPMNLESAVYDRAEAVESPDAKAIKLAEQVKDEHPDGGYSSPYGGVEP